MYANHTKRISTRAVGYSSFRVPENYQVPWNLPTVRWFPPIRYFWVTLYFQSMCQSMHRLSKCGKCVARSKMVQLGNFGSSEHPGELKESDNPRKSKNPIRTRRTEYNFEIVHLSDFLGIRAPLPVWQWIWNIAAAFSKPWFRNVLVIFFRHAR